MTVPTGCITASALHSLARALERLSSFHKLKGGSSPDEPCLTEVFTHEGHVFARVQSGRHRFKLQLVAGEWEFR